MLRRKSKIKALPCGLERLGPVTCGQIYIRARSLPTSHSMSRTHELQLRHRSWREMGKQREEGRIHTSKLGPGGPNGRLTAHAERQSEGPSWIQGWSGKLGWRKLGQLQEGAFLLTLSPVGLNLIKYVNLLFKSDIFHMTDSIFTFSLC